MMANVKSLISDIQKLSLYQQEQLLYINAIHSKLKSG